MAYCVHCGVKLGESEKKCPLCGTPVLDPASPVPRETPRAYPVRTPEQDLKRNTRFLLLFTALMLLLPAGLCIVIDLLLGEGLSWSIYAAGAMILLFVSVAVPLLVSKFRAYFTVGTVFLCLNLYLFLVEQISGSQGWFLPIALPALALAAAGLAGLILLYRRGWLNKLTLPAALLLAAAAECLAIEWLCIRARGGAMHFVWSPFVMSSCVFIALALFFINSNRAVREEVRRRVHF